MNWLKNFLDNAGFTNYRADEIAAASAQAVADATEEEADRLAKAGIDAMETRRLLVVQAHEAAALVKKTAAQKLKPKPAPKKKAVAKRHAKKK